MQVSPWRVSADLSRGLVRTLLREGRSARHALGVDSIEALGRVLGCVGTTLSAGKVAAHSHAPVTRLARVMGARCFVVLGPDETLVFDAERRRLTTLTREQRQALELLVEASDLNADLEHRLMSERALDRATARAALRAAQAVTLHAAS